VIYEIEMSPSEHPGDCGMHAASLLSARYYQTILNRVAGKTLEQCENHKEMQD